MIAQALRQAIGSESVRGATEIEPRRLRDWAVAAAPGDAPAALVMPRTTSQVSDVLRVCHAARVPVVVQGGLTGLAGGATPVAGCVLLSLERMHAIEGIDPLNATLTVQAGTPLQVIQQAAQHSGWLFPMDIGSRGSCTIGGNVATNAGGNRVLRYGMTRDLVVGIEVVLADGTVLDSLQQMQKNNAGYDLKQLFVGSEGTLGVITRVVLRIVPQTQGVHTALCAMTDIQKAGQLLTAARQSLGGCLSAFEMMLPTFYRLATDTLRTAPLPAHHGAYVLLESAGFDAEADSANFTRFLERMMEDGIVADAVLAQSLKETEALWAVREAGGHFLPALGERVGFDISVPSGAIEAFLDRCLPMLQARWPDCLTVCFGHMADGNLHLIVKTRDAAQPVHAVEEAVYDCVRELRGSVAAEHGVGLHRKEWLGYSRSPAEITVMRQLKAMLDPAGILNPGKVL